VWYALSPYIKQRHFIFKGLISLLQHAQCITGIIKRHQKTHRDLPKDFSQHFSVDKSLQIAASFPSFIFILILFLMEQAVVLWDHQL
jgi:hypothetical protein